MITKDSSPKEKFFGLKEWHPHIFSLIKRDIKNEHLRNDPSFAKKYLGKNFLKVETEELINAYQKAIENGEEHLIDFIFQSWLLKHSDVYHFFADELSKITSDFSQIELIEENLSEEIVENGVKQFGALSTYLFSVMNGVVFPKHVFETLNKKAQEEEQEKKQSAEELQINQDRESLIRHYETKIQRLTDKYEKKLLGLEKKYIHDIEALKKNFNKRG